MLIVFRIDLIMLELSHLFKELIIAFEEPFQRIVHLILSSRLILGEFCNRNEISFCYLLFFFALYAFEDATRVALNSGYVEQMVIRVSLTFPFRNLQGRRVGLILHLRRHCRCYETSLES